MLFEVLIGIGGLIFYLGMGYEISGMLSELGKKAGDKPFSPFAAWAITLCWPIIVVLLILALFVVVCAIGIAIALFCGVVYFALTFIVGLITLALSITIGIIGIIVAGAVFLALCVLAIALVVFFLVAPIQIAENIRATMAKKAKVKAFASEAKVEGV